MFLILAVLVLLFVKRRQKDDRNLHLYTQHREGALVAYVPDIAYPQFPEPKPLPEPAPEPAKYNFLDQNRFLDSLKGLGKDTKNADEDFSEDEFPSDIGSRMQEIYTWQASTVMYNELSFPPQVLAQVWTEEDAQNEAQQRRKEQREAAWMQKKLSREPSFHSPNTQASVSLRMDPLRVGSPGINDSAAGYVSLREIQDHRRLSDYSQERMLDAALNGVPIASLNEDDEKEVDEDAAQLYHEPEPVFDFGRDDEDGDSSHKYRVSFNSPSSLQGYANVNAMHDASYMSLESFRASSTPAMKSPAAYSPQYQMRPFSPIQSSHLHPVKEEDEEDEEGVFSFVAE